MSRAYFSALLALPLLAFASQLLADEVTIYRCIGKGNTLTLRDSPCAKGETQEVRAMQRPKDPAPGSMPARQAPASVPDPPPRREVQVIYRTPPRPLYECVTAEGDKYTSENGEGNPRSVPLWTLGYPLWTHRGGANRPDRPGQPGRPPPQGGVYPIGNTWVRDECHELPQQEVCDRLSDQRYEMIRRYNSANQGERRQLELDQRSIEARISNDCRN